jgi:Ser-tRNA(Ala) deacylase AlaX
VSDKTFLQELESIKKKAELFRDYIDVDSSTPEEMEKIDEIIDDVKTMINKCIEIQLAMMKQDRMKG